jgi:signal recognition particle receptor subunit alpha
MERGETTYNPKQEVEEEDYSKKSDVTDWTPIKGVQKLQESTFGAFWKKLTGEKPLTDEVLDPMMVTFREHLASKNVAAEIAGKICESVKASLLGKKLGTFASVKSAVKAAMEEAITRILTPKRQIEILQEVDALKKSSNPRPYVITFCGVNGVGKSTNLAKLCRLIVETGFTPMIAACDTFRSGAVEQLEIHAKKLKVELFARGTTLPYPSP